MNWSGEQITKFTIPFVLAVAVLEALVLRFQGKRRHDATETVSSLLFSGIALSFELSLRLLGFGLYKTLALHSPFPEWKLTWAVFAMTFVFSDYLAYWSHRICHEVNLFWTAHLVHHQPTTMNLTVGFRTSLTQRFVNIGMGLAAAALNLPFEYYFASLSIITVYAFWCHTETIRRIPVFEWIFVTPSHHRVHHATNPQYLDKNYGNVFIVWDRLHGTFADELEKPVYGITDALDPTSVYESYLKAPLTLFREARRRPFSEGWRILFGSPETFARIVGKYPSSANRDSLGDAPIRRLLGFVPERRRRAASYALFVAFYALGFAGLALLRQQTAGTWTLQSSAIHAVTSIGVASVFYFALKSFLNGRNACSIKPIDSAAYPPHFSRSPLRAALAPYPFPASPRKPAYRALGSTSTTGNPPRP